MCQQIEIYGEKKEITKSSVKWPPPRLVPFTLTLSIVYVLRSVFYTLRVWQYTIQKDKINQYHIVYDND